MLTHSFSTLSIINQEHSNVGAASLLFFSGSIRRLLQEMDDKMLLTEQERVKHEIDYYANLLADPQAMEEFRAETQRTRNHHHERELQLDVLRQNVTFIGCRFEENTYGIADAATNYGALAAETADNDLVVRESIFSGNQFGDINIVVRTIQLTDCLFACLLAIILLLGNLSKTHVLACSPFNSVNYRGSVTLFGSCRERRLS